MAANVAAFAAGLAEMVANVTLAGKTPPADPESLQRVSIGGEALRNRLLALALADEQAYGSYRAASSLPRSTDDEKAARRAALDAALVTAADVPMAIARAGVELLGLLTQAAQQVTTHVLSDVSTAAVLTEGAVRGALFTATVNADLMKDASRQESLRVEIASLTARASNLVQLTLTAVEAR